MRDWQAYAIALFAVAAGQAARIGQKVEQGKAITWRDAAVMGSILPAFGSIGGAAATHYGWPIPVTLIVGIASGWMGFATMRAVVAMAQQIAGQIGKPRDD